MSKLLAADTIAGAVARSIWYNDHPERGVPGGIEGAMARIHFADRAPTPDQKFFVYQRSYAAVCADQKAASMLANAAAGGFRPVDRLEWLP